MHQSVIKRTENFDIIDWIVKMIIYVYKDNPIAVQINSSIKNEDSKYFIAILYDPILYFRRNSSNNYKSDLGLN